MSKKIVVSATEFKRNYGIYRLEAMKGATIEISCNNREPEVCLISTEQLNRILDQEIIVCLTT